MASKSDLITSLAAKHPTLTQKQVKALVDDFLEEIITTLGREGSVNISDFGGFVLRDVRARVARNPRTGEPITIPATRKASFRVAKAFKERVAKI